MNVVLSGMTPTHATQVSMHRHAEWEIVYYFSGKGVLSLGGNAIPFEEGDIVCEPPGTAHSEFSQNGFRDIYVRVNDFVSPCPGIPHFKDNGNRDFYNIISQLYREYHIKQNNWSRIVDQLFGVLYQYMLAWNDVTKKNPLVEEFEGILVSNISNPNFRLNDFLGKIPLSEDHFRKLFKKETGKSPIEYLIDKRIQHAKQLLESYNATNLRIKEIAGFSGFDDQYYFSRLFKKIAGKSPTEWQKQKGI